MKFKFVAPPTFTSGATHHWNVALKWLQRRECGPWAEQGSTVIFIYTHIYFILSTQMTCTCVFNQHIFNLSGLGCSIVCRYFTVNKMLQAAVLTATSGVVESKNNDDDVIYLKAGETDIHWPEQARFKVAIRVFQFISDRLA